MIPAVMARHEGAGTLTSYLVDTVKHDHHVNPHIVAGSPLIVARYDERILTMQDAKDMAFLLERSQKASGVRVKGGHVWHCALSLKGGQDAPRTNAEWNRIATSFLRRMEFIGAEGKADTPFVAVHHGPNGKGNDHIHLAVSLVREDGTRADFGNDYRRAQAAARELEKEHGLVQLSEGRGARYPSPAEVKATEIGGRDEPLSESIARRVRAAHAVSETEAEFVVRVRDMGVLLFPRMQYTAHDGIPEARGYAAGLDPAHESNRGMKGLVDKDGEVIAFGGGKLGNDLTLGVLKQTWHESEGDRINAAAEWVLAQKNLPANMSLSDQPVVSPKVLMATVYADLDARRQRLESLSHDDKMGWARETRQLAGELAFWSWTAEGPKGGPLQRVSDALGKASQMSRAAYRKDENPQEKEHPRGRAFAAAVSAAGRAMRHPWLTVLEETAKLAQQVHRHLREVDDKVKADMLREVAQREFRDLLRDMKAPGVDAPLRAVTVAEAHRIGAEVPRWYGVTERLMGDLPALDRARLEEVFVRDMTAFRDTGKLDTPSVRAEWAAHTGHPSVSFVQGPQEPLQDYLARKNQAAGQHWERTAGDREKVSGPQMRLARDEASRVLQGLPWGRMNRAGVPSPVMPLERVHAELNAVRDTVTRFGPRPEVKESVRASSLPPERPVERPVESPRPGVPRPPVMADLRRAAAEKEAREREARGLPVGGVAVPVAARKDAPGVPGQGGPVNAAGTPQAKPVPRSKEFVEAYSVARDRGMEPHIAELVAEAETNHLERAAMDPAAVLRDRQAPAKRVVPVEEIHRPAGPQQGPSRGR